MVLSGYTHLKFGSADADDGSFSGKGPLRENGLGYGMSYYQAGGVAAPIPKS